jgi:isoquinoline 1-oxidoreductase beta subunit
MVLQDKKPVVSKVIAAVDCGIVVNKDASVNMGEGAIVDAIGNALYGELTFKEGVPSKTNFHQYRMIRQQDAPKAIEVHFVESKEDPTGLGEPFFPPVFAALANSLYKATGKRFYQQPFGTQLEKEGFRV